MNTDLKKLTRLIIQDEVKKLLEGEENLQGFSLPADNFILEQDLKSSLNMNFAGVEHSKEVFEKGKILADNLGFKYHNQSIKEFFENNYRKYNFIWLDYCSNFSLSMIKELKIILSADNFDLSNKNSIFSITLAGRRDPQLKVVTDFLNLSYDNVKNRELARIAGIPKLLMHYMEQWNTGIELVPLRHIKYHDSVESNRMPMHLHMFRVKKVFENSYTKYELGLTTHLTNRKMSITQ